MAGIKFVSLLLVCMVVAPMTCQAITCGQVASSLSQCLTYLRTGGAPPSGCCNGVRAINNAARTTPDRRIACNCLKSAASNIPGLNSDFAASLPGKCSVSIPYKISLATNCNSIK